MDERKKLILSLLEQKGSITVGELVERTQSSESSIRRDLSQLDEKGYLKRVHGGAVSVSKMTSTMEDSLGKRQLLHAREKRNIARVAASLIEKNDVVYIDAGSSTLEMIDYLTQKEARYITNGLIQAQQLTLKGFHVLCIGGEIRNVTGACVGANAIAVLKKYHFTKGFFGSNGIDLDAGLTTYDGEEAAIKELAINQSQQSYVLCDHSKFNCVYPVSFSNLEKVKIISDYAPKEFDQYVIKVKGEK